MHYTIIYKWFIDVLIRYSVLICKSIEVEQKVITHIYYLFGLYYNNHINEK